MRIVGENRSTAHEHLKSSFCIKWSFAVACSSHGRTYVHCNAVS